MAKKFGKFLLCTAAVGAAAVAAYMYFQKKDVAPAAKETEDEDYDDFNEDLEDPSSRNYVSLSHETPADTTEAETPAEETTDAETVEEFFDEENTSSEEAPAVVSNDL